MKRRSIGLFFLIINYCGFSQSVPSKTWSAIDAEIRRKEQLSVTDSLLERIRQQSMSKGQHFDFARACYYQLRIADLRSEDTVYFRNSTFIDSILNGGTKSVELEAAMHLLQARRLGGFAHKYLRFSRQLYRQKNTTNDYAAYSDQQLDSIANIHFEKAKTLSKNLSGFGLEEYLWLSADPFVFLFKPSLFDIIIAEQIKWFAQTGRNNYFHIKRKHLFRLSQEEFIATVQEEIAVGNIMLKLYDEWLRFHQHTPPVYYFIETLARKHVWTEMGGIDGDNTNQYQDYLLMLGSSPLSMVKAHGVYQLALIWKEQAEKYFPAENYPYYYGDDHPDFDTAYKYHAVKALQLIERNRSVFDSFTYLGNALAVIEQEIKKGGAGVNLRMPNVNLPGEAILAELNFKNAEKLYYKILRVDHRLNLAAHRQKSDLTKLTQYPEVLKQEIVLPVITDYNRHAMYLKFDPLPVGKYVLIFSARSFEDNSILPECIPFSVSSIAVVNTNTRAFVVDRKTGFPLSGAGLLSLENTGETIKEATIIAPKIARVYTTNKQGFTNIKDDRHQNFLVVYNNDTLSATIKLDQDKEMPDDIYSKKEYDDLVEFYEENAVVHVYTDRSIYRPGQTVHYKAVFLTKNRKTGKLMLMNKANMKAGLFRDIYKRMMKESEPKLAISDAFGKKAKEILVKLNHFGSQSGSFILPRTAPTGDWSIETDYLDSEGGEFRVEEYKRPSYELIIDKLKQELLPGDSFPVKINTRSFAGAVLNGVRINYTVKRNGLLPLYNEKEGKPVLKDSVVTLLDTFAFTNAQGGLVIIVNDTALKDILLAKEEEWHFNYTIEATVIDNTGESYEADANFRILSRPVIIRLPSGDKYDLAQQNKLLFTTSDRNAGQVNKWLRVKLSRVIKQETFFGKRKLGNVDCWLYPKDQLQAWFPSINIFNKEDTGTKKLVLDTVINTGDGRITIDGSRFSPGSYELETICEQDGTIRGDAKKFISLFDSGEKKMPGKAHFFYHLDYNSVAPGDTVSWYSGNSSAPVYSIFYARYFSGKNGTAIVDKYEIVRQGSGLNKWQWKLPNSVVNRVLLTQVYVYNNEVFHHKETIYVNEEKAVEPEIIIEKYRKKLSPGSMENFVLSIKTRNDNIAAELMTTMYDASLDKLEMHKWGKPHDRETSYLRDKWETNIGFMLGNLPQFLAQSGEMFVHGGATKKAGAPLWWMNKDGDDQQMGDWNMFSPSGIAGPGDSITYALQGRVAGITVSGLSEVVALGYGQSVKARAMSSVSAIHIRGAVSLASYSQPLIVLDGIPFDGDLSKLDPQSITQGLVLKGADAVSIYGARAAGGVLVLSTKGDILFPEAPSEELLPARKNFSESAFFFPAIHADKNGYYSFSFTMPETVAEWNWKTLAFTKKASFAYLERKLNTQLPLMVQPNMPRLLYQGDRIVLKSRISNLDSLLVKGKASCSIEDMLTGEDLTTKWVTNATVDFEVGKLLNGSVAFALTVPVSQLNPVKITVRIRSENFSDGEEHVIPILSSKLFVQKAEAFSFQGKDTTITVAGLPTGADMYGMGLSIPEQPQSAMLQSLPYLANFPADCAEQLSNKIFANATAIKIMREDSIARLSFSNIKNQIEKPQTVDKELPDPSTRDAMPWVSLGLQTQQQQEKLFRLLDTTQTILTIRQELEKLYKLQQADGGLSWFPGGKSNPYITQYVLRNLGLMKSNNLLLPVSVFSSSFYLFIGKLVAYCDRFVNTNQESGRLQLDYLLARSYWISKYPLPDSIKQATTKILEQQWQNASKLSLFSQSQLIILSLRNSHEEDEINSKAKKLIESIRQLAIVDKANGMRWKDIADAERLDISAEETLAILTEAFEEAGNAREIRIDLLRWLLSSRSEYHWFSTKATAAVLMMMVKGNPVVTGNAQKLEANAPAISLSVTNDLLQGNSYGFSRVNGKVKDIALTKANTDGVQGQFNWYYFTEMPAQGISNGELSIEKNLFLQTKKNNNWEQVGKKTVFNAGDKIKVVLTIQSPKALQYVFIEDKRAAALSPVNNSSGYEYGKGFSWYKSVRDASVQFFADFIPAGKQEISYELKIEQVGEFSSGSASLQCMYRPGATAYSGGSRIVVGE